MSKRAIYLSRVLFGGARGTISTAFIRGYCADHCVRHGTIFYGPSFDDSLRQGSIILTYFSGASPNDDKLCPVKQPLAS